MDDEIINKLKLANKNIEELVYKILQHIKEENSMYCCYPEKQNSCNGKCDKCKLDYYKKNS